MQDGQKKGLDIKTKREVHVITVQTLAHRVKNLNKNHVRHQPTAPPPTKTTPRPFPTPPLHPTEKKSKEKKKGRTRTEKEKRSLARSTKGIKGKRSEGITYRKEGASHTPTPTPIPLHLLIYSHCISLSEIIH
jgi:hypothetical protein